MSEKVVITKDQAEALEDLIETRKWSNASILETHLADLEPWDISSPLNGLDFDTLAKALYIGYEVEPTPEEIILNRYNQAKEGAKDVANIYKQYEGGAVDAIEMVLRTLKIEIEGIHK